MTTSFKKDRPTWDEWAIGIATAVSMRADCRRRMVGAIIVGPDHSVLSVGYNGSPPGGPSCLAGQCPRGLSDVPSGSSYDTGPGSCIGVHAEQNAIIRARGSLAGSTIYVTCKPCEACERMIRATEIVRVVYPGMVWCLK